MQKRVQIKNLVQDQVPQYVRDQYPEFVEFLVEYYKTLEDPGGPLDIVNNIDSYTELNQLAELVFKTDSTEVVGISTNIVRVTDTFGFPERNGLIKIDDELIHYKTKTPTSFDGCSRGFVGITSYYGSQSKPPEFERSLVGVHTSGESVFNLNALLLTELYKKYKKQYAPGFDDLKFFEALNEKVAVSRLKDFYSAKGANSSFEVLFKLLYGVDVDIVKPRDFLIQPSDADYRITRDLVVERLLGDPEDLVNRTLNQDATATIPKAAGTITDVERIFRDGVEYFRLSLDYNPELETFVFSVHPKTRVTNKVAIGQTYIDVDSTLSFKDEGTLVVFDNGVEQQIEYTSKSSTQFFGLESPVALELEQNITTPDYAYARIGDDEVRVKVTGVLGDLEYDRDASFYYQPGDQIEIVSLGTDSDEARNTNWIINSSPEYEIAEITQVALKLNGAAQYRIKTFDPHIFTLGDIGTVAGSDGTLYDIFVIAISDEFEFDINLTTTINTTNVQYTIRKGISKAKSLSSPELNIMSANVQNVYVDDDDTYVVASSLPDYYNTPITIEDLSVTFSGQFDGEEINIGANAFTTGDAVNYSYNNNIGLDIAEGQYFVYKLNTSTIKLATSRSNIRSGVFIKVFGTINDNKLELVKFGGLTLQPQDVIRKFSPPTPADNPEEAITSVGNVGMLVNGVEILNYKSSDTLYYGPIEAIEVSAPGEKNYDVINPPILTIDDNTGTGNSNFGDGAEAVVNVVGSLSRINIISKGFDYVEAPKVTISGGNGRSAEAKCNTSKITHSVRFNAGSLYDNLNINDNTIGFTTDHKLRDFERVIYSREDQQSIGGLVDDSIYFVRKVDATTIKLHNTAEDAIVGVNTINFTSYGDGLQKITAFEKKNVVSSVEVVNPGEGYTNKTLFFREANVNTYNNTIDYVDHGYFEKDLIRFDSEVALPTGINSTSEYYVSLVSKDSFRIAEYRPVGIGSTLQSDYNYLNNRFVEFVDGGTGIHNIKYRPITVSLEAPIGITTTVGQDFFAKIEPVFTGEIVSVSIKNGGNRYGDENVLNYNRQPQFELSSGNFAQLSPIVSAAGRIIGIIVNNGGSGYNSPPEIRILGAGTGAILTPIIKDGKIEEIIIIDGGFGYEQVTTAIQVVPSGSGAQFRAKIKNWTINAVERIIQSNKLGPDDGILTPALTREKGLQYVHGFAGREFRRKVLATSIDLDGNTIYRDDIENDTDSVLFHSPIIGWAYDGHPIYGPYGYADKEGGAIKRIQTSYGLELNPDRPTTSQFPSGIFLEDYVFVGNGDLDIHNGRYCKTPEFPDGVYAYFATINSTPEADGPLNGFRKPLFPYIIGNSYKSKPIAYNFDRLSNTLFYNINESGWVRYTGHLGLLNKYTKYAGFLQPDDFSEGFTEIEDTTAGQVNDLIIVSPGDNYSLSDQIFFDNAGTSGAGAYARIVELGGKQVDNITYNESILDNVQFTPFKGDGRFVGFGSTSHGYKSGDMVSIQNLNILSTKFGSTYPIGISTNTLVLSNSIGNAASSGIVTYFNVSGNLTFPTLSTNDLYLINGELVKVLNVFIADGRIRVQRAINNTSSAHITGTELLEQTRKLTVTTGFSTATEYKLDKTYYFDPRESVIISSENLLLYSDPIPAGGIGTQWNSYTAGIGTGSVLYYNSNAPDGTSEAARVSLGGTTGNSDAFGIQYESVGLSVSDYSVSVFLRGNTGGEEVYIILEDGLTFHSQKVTLTTKWQRFSMGAFTNAGQHRLKIGTLGTENLTLNSAPVFYVWGAQIEEGVLTSTYYSTQGTAVVRADNKVGLLYLSNPSITQEPLITPRLNSFYLPNHGFDTNQLLTYNVGAGGTGVSVSIASTIFPLENDDKLYIAAFDKDFIGISTMKVGLGSTGTFVGVGTEPLKLYGLTNYGGGEIHSFTTNQPLTIVGDVYKKTATVTTKVSHQLSDGDNVVVDVVSGIQTSIKIIYDDINRRMVVDPREFIDSDINIERNSITLPNHRLRNGEKVIFNSSSPPQGLDNSRIYYVIKLDDNTICLSNFYYEVISSNEDVEIVNIETQSFGKISPINPEIFGVRDSTLVFDLSDQTLTANSLPAFNFFLYSNEELTDEFFYGERVLQSFDFLGIQPVASNEFSVKTSGIIGEPGAKLELIISDSVPTNLFYNLTPIQYNGASEDKLGIIVDNFNIRNSNKLTITGSGFNLSTPITGVTTNTFNYTLTETPERGNYPSNEANIKYTTTSLNAVGPVESVKLDSIGRGFRSLPNVSKIVSAGGTGAIFLPESTSLGKVNSLVLTDIGFDYPPDKTLRPIAQFPYTYKIEPLSKFDNIKIANPGVNYFIPPQLIVLDGFTGRVNSEVSLDYNIGDTEVTIVRNTTGLYNVTPKILPVNNPNGVRIQDINYDSGTKEVTIGFAVTFSSAADYPFKVGDKVIVENTNTDTTVLKAKGYNSADYGYTLFKLTAVDPDLLGDNPTIKYSLADELKPGEEPGNFDSFDSFGTVTPESYFPQFDITLEKDSFRVGEIIVSQDDNVGIVQSYDLRNEYLRVRSKIPFKIDDLIIGQSSQNKGLISSVDGISSKYKIESNSIIRKGWLKNTGKLNQFFQRMHDNDYYQYFSYSVRSSISYEDWNPIVSNLNHTAGFKKFSELVIDSYDPTISGIQTAQDLNTVIAISDLTNIVDVNTVKDFDIAREKSIEVSGKLVSNEILFNLPFLAKYQEFIGNRVLTIDDFSDQFNGENRGFELFTDNNPIFEIEFNGSDPNRISVGEGSIDVTNHYFVSGELIEYVPPGNNPANSIQIQETDFGVGIGTTTLLPSQFYIIKQDNQKVRVAISATNALLFNPIGVGLTGVGIGSTHIFRAIEPNNRLLITVNGTIQSPMVGTAVTTALSANVGIGSTVINVAGITSIFGGDIIRVNDEVMLVAASDDITNTLTVRRAWMGSTEATHNNNTVMVKQAGNYAVVRNSLHFIEGPWGDLPVGLGTTAQNAGEADYTGLTTSSRFSGRIFLRSALTQAFTTSFLPAYDNNFIYDDISNQFNGINTSFTLKYEGNDIDNITSQNTIILIDDIFQGPQRLGNVLTNIEGDYKLEAGGGALQLGFNAQVSDPSNHGDINVNNVPKGGVIVSVASKDGYGFQPLVGAGGTALVSAAGSVTNISIGNTGSGYRSGIQNVSVGIQTFSLGVANITNIGIATVVDGHVVGVAITNPQVFYAPREVSNIGYSSITGVTTVTTSTPHNLGLGQEIEVVGAAFTCDYYPPVDVTNALYDTTTGIMTVTTGVTTFTVSDFIYDNTTGITTVTTVEPMKIVPMTAIGRSFSLAGIAMTCVGYGQTFAVTNFVYNNSNGIAEITVDGDHGLSNGDDFKMRELIFSCNVGGPTGYGQTFTITQFIYDNVTGLSTVTTSTPITGIIGIGSDVRLDNLEFSCPGGSGVTTSIFPDGTQGNTFTVSNVVDASRFELNVGVSTIPHTYVENDAGQVTAGLTTTKFPDGSQGYFFKVVTVGTTTSFTVNVGPSTISHSYVSGGVLQVGITTDIFPGNLQNSPLGDTFTSISSPNWNQITFNAGISTIPHTYVSGGTLTFGHKLKVGTDVALTGLAFTCSYDGGVGILTHPRVSDPSYCGTPVTRINSIDEFEINVGVSTAESFYTSGGIVEEIILAPRVSNNSPSGQDAAFGGTTVIKIVDDFSFIIDSGISPYTHFYKRCGEVRMPLDVIIDEPLPLDNVPLLYADGSSGFGTEATVSLVPSKDSTILNFEVKNFGYGYGSGEKLTVAIGGTTGIQTFASKTSNAILPVIAGGEYEHIYVGGTAANAVQSGGNYLHTFVQAVANGVTSNLGNLPNPVTDAVYTAATGDMVITSAGHGLSTANTISIADNALTFSCAMDGNSSSKTYPRASDPASGATLAISATTTDTFTINVGASPIVNHDVTDATYTPSTGILQLTIGSHSLTTGTSIKIANGSLTFTCASDNHATPQSYPRPSDPFYDTAINIDGVTSTTITLNVGVSTEVRYPVHNATYDPATGLSVLTIGTHNLVTGQGIRLANESLLFKCSLDGFSRIEAYPREFKDVNIHGKTVGITSHTANSITVFAGPSPASLQYQHQFVGVGSYSQFELEVDRVFQSKFSGWNVGEFIVLDEIEQFFNGERRLFPLSVNGDSISFFAKANSGINLQSNLLVFVNDILQTPGEGYQFTGGSTIRFTEAPKGGLAGFTTEGDKAKIFMYTGTQTIDVRTVDVLPTVEVGDEVQLYSNQDTTFTQDRRLVMDIKAADKIITNNYAGQGVTLNELFERPISWSKQAVDKIIDNVFIGKDRVYYEPVINPTTNIISSPGIARSEVYVYDVRPLFDNPFEGIAANERTQIEIISQDRVEPATARAVIGAAGTIANVILTNPGYGYTTAPIVTIASPYDDGTQATATAVVSAGSSLTSVSVGSGGTNYYYGPLTSISVNSQGSGFPPINTDNNVFRGARLKTDTGIGVGAVADLEINTLNFEVASIVITEGGKDYQVGDKLFVDTYDNVGLATTTRGFALSSPIKFTVANIAPPQVLIAPPRRRSEECSFVTYEGDYGLVVGVGTTTVGAGTSLGVVFDLYIPMDSEIRRGAGITLPGITTGDLFNLTRTNFVSAGQTSFSADGSVIGISTLHGDMTYECIDYYTKQSVIPAGLNGLGTTVGFGTTVTSVVVTVQSAGSNNVVGVATTSLYGYYTWGKVGLPVRTQPVNWTINNGALQAGIGTNPLLRRKNPLKYIGYIS